MEQNTESMLQDASRPGRGAGKDEDPYVSEEDTDDEDSFADEVDRPLASLQKYCNTFMEKYSSRRLARNLRKAANSVSTPTTNTDEDEYDFSHERRGLAVIINNVKYKTGDGKVHKRKGSKRDASNLEKVFRHLGFHVKRYNDLTKNQMLQKLQKAASNKKYDHSLVDCFACAILAHGTQQTMREPRSDDAYDALERHDVVYGVDWKEVHTAYLTSIFNDECCPGLQGKPRLFIIQACRGDDHDVGHEITVLKTKKTKKCLRKQGSGKGHDGKDAISSDSDSDSESDSDSDSDSESGPGLELASDLELVSDQEHGKEAEEEPMKRKRKRKHEIGEIQQMTEVHEQSTEIKANKQIEEEERKQTEQELDQMEDMKENCEGREGSEQMTKVTETGKEQEQGTMQRTVEVQSMQMTKDTSTRDTGGPMSPSSSKSHTKREELIVSPPPIYKDFLLVYAAPPGYFAWRNKKGGGWLIQELKNVLMTKDAFRVSLSRLLTQVSWKVAKDFKSSNDDKDLHERKLVPCVMSMLTKDMYFRKKGNGY